MTADSFAASFLSAEQVGYAYKEKPVLQNISFSLPAGSYISLVGPNGSGKSTLFRLLCGYYAKQQGQILYEGHPLDQIPVRERARQFAVIHQNESTAFSFRCLEYVCLGFSPHKGLFAATTGEELQRAYTLLSRMGIAHLADRWITEISGGEKQKVILCRALAQQPRILFIDEGMSALDIHGKLQCIQLLKKEIAHPTEQKDFTVFAIQHDLQMAYQYSDYVLALKSGCLAAQGPPKDCMTESFFANIFQIQAEIIKGKGFFLQES